MVGGAHSTELIEAVNHPTLLAGTLAHHSFLDPPRFVQ